VEPKHRTERDNRVAADVADARRREEGQTTAEYAVALSAITLAIITGIGVLSGTIQGSIESVAKIIPG
jgi:Flp pilus assembly pilin Flp